MKKTKVFYQEVAFCIAMITNSFALSLLVKSVFGISTLSSLPLVFSNIFPQISFGMWTYIVQTIMLCILMAITRQPKVSYIFSFVIGYIFGLLTDLTTVIVAYLPDIFLLRIMYFAAGWTLISFGGALFIKSQMPLMANDCVIADLSRYFKVKVKLVKTIADLIFVISASILSLTFLHELVGVGIGTIFAALFTGSFVQFFVNKLDSFDFQTKTKFGAKMKELAAIQTK